MSIVVYSDSKQNTIELSKSITVVERNSMLYIHGRIYYDNTFENIRKSTGKRATNANKKWVEKNKKELLWELSKYKQQLNKKNEERKSSILFTEVAEKVLRTKFSVTDNEYGISEFTKKEYKSMYEKRIKPYFQNYYISDIDIELVEEWQNWVLTKQYDRGFSNYKNEKKKSLSVKSLKNTRIVLNMIFKDCVQKKHMEKNPLDIVKVPKRNKKSIETVSYLTLNEIKKVLKSFDSYISNTNKDYEIRGRKQFQNVFLTMIGSGMRSGEIIGLQWDDIDFENETVSIKRRVREGDIALPKSSSSVREFTLLKEAMDALKEQKKLFKDENSKWVFLNRYNNPFKSPQQFDIRYKEVLKLSGLNSDRFYSLRHTYATNMIVNDVENFVVVSGILGHKDSVITQKTYVSNKIYSSRLKGKSLFD